MTIDLIARANATQATRDEFAGRMFEPGVVDCVTVAHSHLKRLGHAPPNLPHYKTARGGMLALKRMGHASLAALLDGMLEPISPAAMMIGDVALAEGEGRSEALAICQGRKVMVFHEDYPVMVNLEPERLDRAWRV